MYIYDIYEKLSFAKMAFGIYISSKVRDDTRAATVLKHAQIWIEAVRARINSYRILIANSRAQHTEMRNAARD